MKRKLLIGMVLVMVALLLPACGIPQEDYDAVVAERDTAQADASSLQSKLDDAERELATAKSDLAAAQSQIESLESDVSSANSRASSANSKLEAANSELSAIKEVYPPRDFSSLSELQDWLLKNDVSERSPAEFAETLYMKALEIQEAALNDGYIVSADIDYDPATGYTVACVTIINGDLWVWHPEGDEPINFSEFADFQEVR